MTTTTQTKVTDLQVGDSVVDASTNFVTRVTYADTTDGLTCITLTSDSGRRFYRTYRSSAILDRVVG